MNWKDKIFDDEKLWPKELKIKLDNPHIDNRGSIQSLLNFPSKNISLITSKKKSVRSNHYHLTDWHYMYVLSGSFDYYFCKLNDIKNIKKIKVSEGEMVFTPPKEVHATVFLEDTKLLAISRNPRDQKYYESDLKRLVIIDPDKIIKNEQN